MNAISRLTQRHNNLWDTYNSMYFFKKQTNKYPGNTSVLNKTAHHQESNIKQEKVIQQREIYNEKEQAEQREKEHQGI